MIRDGCCGMSDYFALIDIELQSERLSDLNDTVDIRPNPILGLAQSYAIQVAQN